MKAPIFTYKRPEHLGEALDLLADNDGGTQVLAGGQSLMATLNMRLSSPAELVDINRIAALRGIEPRDTGIRLGALVRHADVLASATVAQHVPLLALALPHVAHMAVRNRGTTCGSLALADPSAEMPAVAVTLNADIVLAKKGGQRTVPARGFFQGLYQTARQDDEMITEVVFPVASTDELFGFAELSRRHGDFATVGVAVRAVKVENRLDNIEVTIFGSEATPLLSKTASSFAIAANASDKILGDMAIAIADDMEPMDNHQGRGETKRRQGATLIRRTLRDVLQRAFLEQTALS